jgi:hypothetical protein
MGFFAKLFGKKQAQPTPTLSPELAAALQHPPRLVNEGPEFPREPVVLDRAVAPAQIEAALAGGGFVRGEDGKHVRGETIVEYRDENGVTLLAFSGGGILEAQRELLARLPWIDPMDRFYERMESPATPIEELRHLLCALRHYKCVGGIPRVLRGHKDPEIQETVRLIDRDQMAAAARAQRSRKKG